MIWNFEILLFLNGFQLVKLYYKGSIGLVYCIKIYITV